MGKRTAVAVGIMSFLASGGVFAAEDEEDAEAAEAKQEALGAPAEHATASVLIEPALAIIGFFEGDVGIALDESVAVGVWGQFFDYTLLDTGISGYGVGLGAPFFLTGEVFRGAYLYPLIKFQSVSFTADGVDELTATFYGPQLTAGYEWTWGRPVGFSMRIGGGVEYSFGTLESDNYDDSLSFEGIDYELDAAIGVTF